MIKYLFYFVLYTVLLITNSVTLDCQVNDARKTNCSNNEYCVNGVCECLPGYHSVGDECVKDKSKDDSISKHIIKVDKHVSDDTHQSNIAIVILVPIVLIIIIIGSVFVISRYNIINWVRNKIHQRDSPYDEVMIGQDDDDPPLSGV